MPKVRFWSKIQNDCFKMSSSTLKYIKMDRLTEGTHTHPMAMNFWYQTLFNAVLSCFMLDIYL